MKKKNRPSSVELLQIADRASRFLNKAEHMNTWKSKCLIQARSILEENGKEELVKNPFLMLQGMQLLREAGRSSYTHSLAVYYSCFVFMGGSKELETIPDHPDMEAKMEELTAGLDLDNKQDKLKYGRAWMRCRFASVMRHVGEYEIARKVLNDPETLNQDIRKGYSEFHGEPINLDDELLEAITLYIPENTAGK